MILASRFKSDAQEDFVGGSSLSVNWGSLMRRAGQKLLKNLNPDTLKLRKPVYGGITKDQFIHFMPEDIAKPVALYKNDGKRKWSYMPPGPFFAKAQTDKFTVAPLNGERFLVVAHSEPGATLVIDEMDDITGMTGTANVAVNDHDFISGSAAVGATFNDTGLTMIRTMDDALDLTDYLNGTVIIPIRLQAAVDLSKIELQLRTDASNYYQVSTETDDVDTFTMDGWNYLRFNMANRTTSGAPTVTNIVDWKLIGTATSGDEVDVIIDRMTLQKNAPLWLEGYTDKLFVDGTTGVIKSDVDPDADYVNLNEDVGDIFLLELELMVAQAADASKDRAVVTAITSQLTRAYATYYENHPSEELPVSYNIAPELNRQTDTRPTWDGYRAAAEDSE